ncbi:coiled-coil domain-containing protein 28B-like [Hydractinia symbiolongicarpus]|uniref:coiled-coil domain-containing protein 28B-like n=1 Tax=Hydractinia symbiolongicarpus TaxID=13093 RepID=UPI00254F3E17|nr:coiled-coil domain-containing protein 28B-like [Hydractinia symbiolongicarpus]
MADKKEDDIGQGATEETEAEKRAPNSQAHSFLMDQDYMEEVEDNLLKLLDDFKKGKLNAFDENCSLDKMDQIKTQQEDLAQLHFDLENEDETKEALSEDERAKLSQEKMDKLMKNMETLCSSVQSMRRHSDTD